MLRLINWQGAIGLAASSLLLILFLLQIGQSRHWKKQSGQYELLYRREQATFAGTVAEYRAAAEAARAADAANAERVAAAQSAINERTSHDFETRLAAARARADRLLRQAQSAATDPGGRASPPMPGLSAAASQTSAAAVQDRLPRSDRLIATEQAIQLDELIAWVRRQHGVKSN